MRTVLVAAALACTAIDCGGSSPDPVAPTTASRWALSGTVRGDGLALIAASVTVLKQPLPVLVTQATTDGGGRYVFPSIDEGSYFLQAGATGYVTGILPVTLDASKTVDFDLPLTPTR